MRDRAADAIAQTCTSIQKQTDLEIDALNTLSLNISYSVLLKEAFQSHVNPNDASSNVDKLTAIDTLDTIYELIIAIIGPNSTAKQINLYDFEGQMIGGGTKNVIVDKNLEEMFWFDETIAKSGAKYISNPYSNSQLFSDIRPMADLDYISFTRLYFDKYRNPPIGIIEIIQPCQKIFSSADTIVATPNYQHQVLIYNEEGTQVYPYQSNAVSKTNYFPLIDNPSKAINSIQFLESSKADGKLICYTTSELTGYTTMIIASNTQLMAPPVYKTTLPFIIIGFIIIAISLIISYLLSS